MITNLKILRDKNNITIGKISIMKIEIWMETLILTINSIINKWWERMKIKLREIVNKMMTIKSN